MPKPKTQGVNLEPISHNLRHIRKLRGMTQAELAKAAGTTQYTVSEIELAHREPHPATLRKLASALGVRIADLYGEAEPTPKVEAPPSQPSFENHLRAEERAEERREPTPEDFQAVGAINDYCDRLEKIISTPDVGPTEVRVAAYIVELVGKLLPALQQKEAIRPVLRPVGARFVRLARRLLEKWRQSGVEVSENIADVIDAAERFDQQQAG